MFASCASENPASLQTGYRNQQQPERPDEVTLFLAGDVMTGRGIDQVLPHPCDPQLFEGYVKSALGYVALAEEANGPIPKPVDFNYVWGDALAELDRRKPDVRLVNLETAVTKNAEPDPKGINYRMNPENAPVLTAAAIDCCTLSNNHILDWGERGLLETLETLECAKVKATGAGRTTEEAQAPAILPVPAGRVIVFAFGSPTSGVPRSWAASELRSGVNFLPDLTSGAVRRIAKQMRAMKKPEDIVVASLHWGRNWGYEIPDEQIAFARGLVEEAGVDIVWGHSPHHPKAIEVHNDKLVIYGCGDFLDDYEGITGYEDFRDDLVLMYFPTLRLSEGALERLTMVPLQIRNFRLNRTSRSDAEWLCAVLNREGKKFGTRVVLGADNALMLEWDGQARNI